MVEQRWIKIMVVLGCAVWATSMSIAIAGKDAAERPPPSGLESGNVLVSGADVIATGKSPAIITVDLAAHDEASQAQLELSILPVTVVVHETYLIVVTEADREDAGEAVRELGSFSFFPPPREGEVRNFYVDLPPILAEMKASGQTRVKLSVGLVPIEPKQGLVSSSLRVVGARIVEG